jgi:serine/threonine-protein kinase RsbW
MVLQVERHRDNAGGGLVHSGAPDLRCAGVPATADQLPRIRRSLASWAQRIGVSADHVHEVVLATYEAMDNVVTHAYPHGGGTFDVHAVYRPDQGYMSVTVSDRGHWRRWQVNPGRHGHGGRGLRLIKALATHTAVDPRAEGTTVRMSWLLPCS